MYKILARHYSNFKPFTASLISEKSLSVDVAIRRRIIFLFHLGINKSVSPFSEFTNFIISILQNVCIFEKRSSVLGGWRVPLLG